MKTLLLKFVLSASILFGFFLISIELRAQYEAPPSDLENQTDINSLIIPQPAQTFPPMMLETAMATMMSLPPHSTNFGGNVRGYWFTAPSCFTITGLRVPEDASSEGQNIEIIRFNSGEPPLYSGTTNDFVSLGRWIGVAGSSTIATSISVITGDVIGILGNRGDINSYGNAPFATTIDGNAVTLTRMGMQLPLSTNVAQDIWQEEGGSISRVELYYEPAVCPSPPVPISDWAIYFGILLIGTFIVVRYKVVST